MGSEGREEKQSGVVRGSPGYEHGASFGPDRCHRLEATHGTLHLDFGTLPNGSPEGGKASPGYFLDTTLQDCNAAPAEGLHVAGKLVVHTQVRFRVERRESIDRTNFTGQSLRHLSVSDTSSRLPVSIPGKAHCVLFRTK